MFMLQPDNWNLSFNYFACLFLFLTKIKNWYSSEFYHLISSYNFWIGPDPLILMTVDKSNWKQVYRTLHLYLGYDGNILKPNFATEMTLGKVSTLIKLHNWIHLRVLLQRRRSISMQKRRELMHMGESDLLLFLYKIQTTICYTF